MTNKCIQQMIRSGILKDRRVFTTNNKYVRFLKPRLRKHSLKPAGLWYSIGSSWMEWCLGEDYNGVGKYVYEIKINPNANILFIDTLEKVFEFSKKYSLIDEIFHGLQLDWDKVMEDYDGIEINPYFHSIRLSHSLLWYYGWDVPSGCLWRACGKKKIQLIAEHNELNSRFEVMV